MGRSKKQTTEDAIVLENGKWKTPDGMCFNTMDKAIKHNNKTTKNNTDGKDE